MSWRSLLSLALGVFTLFLAGAWALGHLLPRLIRPKEPLALAAMEPTSDDLRRELEVHPLVDPYDGRGKAAVIWAARSGRPEAIDLLVRAGAPVRFRDEGPNGWQPLHHAVHKNQLVSVRALLRDGAEVDGTNPDGVTPLMLAAAQGEGEIVETLLAAGADPRREQPGSENALGYALMGGDPRTVRALLRHAPDLTQPPGFKTRLSRFILRLRGRSEILRWIDDRPAQARRSDASPALSAAGAPR